MKGESQVMLSLNEAATRLGVGRIELEALIADGEIEALRGEFLCLIPIREINRLLGGNQPRRRSKVSCSQPPSMSVIGRR